MGIRAWIASTTDGWSVWHYYFFPAELVYFMLGSLAFQTYYNRRDFFDLLPSAFGWAAIAGLAVFAAIFQKTGISWEYRAAFLVPFIVSLPFCFAASRSSGWDRAIGEYSYPVYLIHSVIMKLYSPAHHFVPDEWKSAAVLLAAVGLSWVVIRLDRRVTARLKRTAAGPSDKNAENGKASGDPLPTGAGAS